MMLELNNVTIGELIRNLSVTVGDGQTVGLQGTGKTTLLRAIVGLIPISEGHISIDGELLTPQSASYFRRFMAYVPQQLSLPDGYTKVGDGRWDMMTQDERYLWLLTKAIGSGKHMLVVDAPLVPLAEETQQEVDRLLLEAGQRGATIITVNDHITSNQIRL